jgi:tryptophan synthase beta chain
MINLTSAPARQNIQARQFWPIAAEVLGAYRRHRPAPLRRAAAFGRAAGAAVPIYVRYGGGSIPGGLNPNTAIAQAFYSASGGAPELATGTAAFAGGTCAAAARR